MNGPGQSDTIDDRHPASLITTGQKWQFLDDGSHVFDSPVETGTKLDSHQGKMSQFQGTCGLVSCENILRLAGVDITEEEIVKFASRRHGAEKKRLCTVGLNALNNGGTTEVDRRKILAHYGLKTFCIKPSVEEIARCVEEGRGVIISVFAGILYYGYSVIHDAHAVTVTATKRSMDGKLEGFYICDSNDKPSTFYHTAVIEKALTGQNMNVTESVIR